MWLLTSSYLRNRKRKARPLMPRNCRNENMKTLTPFVRGFLSFCCNYVAAKFYKWWFWQISQWKHWFYHLTKKWSMSLRKSFSNYNAWTIGHVKTTLVLNSFFFRWLNERLFFVKQVNLIQDSLSLFLSLTQWLYLLYWVWLRENTRLGR